MIMVDMLIFPRKQNTLDLFKSAIIDRKSEQIENEILQCFDSLVRKDKLITKLV